MLTEFCAEVGKIDGTGTKSSEVGVPLIKFCQCPNTNWAPGDATWQYCMHELQLSLIRGMQLIRVTF